MKNHIIVLLSILLFVSACEVIPEEITVDSVSLSQPSAEMVVGETTLLKATILPSNATNKDITWASSKQSVASVSNSGLVTAIAEGTSTITASAGGKSATCTIQVSKKVIEVTSVELDKTETGLVEGESITLFATVKPDDATDKTVTWSSSNAAVATVDGNGKVTAIKEGTTTIIAKVGDKQATCIVTVSKKVIEVESITLNKDDLSLEKGKSETLIATVKPDDATDKTVIWSCSDEQTAAVDQNGKVTAIKGGMTTITASAGEKTTECKVTVIVPVESISLDQNSITIEEGQFATLVATVKPDDATNKSIVWNSSDSAIATVDQNGKVTGVKEGNVKITAKAENQSATCSVTVKKHVVAVTSIKLNKTELSLEKGKSETLEATVSPENATDKSMTWTSSDEDVAKVDKNGKVTAVKGGNASITAKAGNKTAECKVTVTVPVESISLNQSSTSLEVEQTITLSANILPQDATEKTVSWTSSNSSVASVDQNGKVTAIAQGTAIIKASAGGKTDTCEINVQPKVVSVTSVTLNKTSLALKEGESETLKATITPSNATNKTVSWSSNKTGIATVDQNGKVTAISKGSATITATAENKSASCDINVTAAANNISFADTTLKKALVDAFDTDGDGELSYEEAAAVSSPNDIMNACAGTWSYLSFDEFQYFTGVQVVSEKMFYKWNIHSIILPKSIISIEHSAFEACYHLETVVLPEGLITIGITAFRDCSSLKNISLPDKLESFGMGAFYGCSSLSSIAIPRKQVVIGVNSFNGCKNLEAVSFLGETEVISDSAFSGCIKLININLPASLRKVSKYAFYKCTSLESVIIPKAQYIEDHAFEDCVSLKQIDITAIEGGGAGLIGMCAFKNCTGLLSAIITTEQMGPEVFMGCKELQTVVLNEGLKTIERLSFGLCSKLKTISLPETVLYVGNNCFKECGSISSITVNRQNPPESGGQMFEGTNNCPIYVPSESVELYKTAENWKNYANRIQAIPGSETTGYVDLGLSVKWATCNLGASNPEEYGDYYAWGESESYYTNLSPLKWKSGKNGYSIESYKWSMGAYYTLTKYCPGNKNDYWGGMETRTIKYN